MLKLERLRRNSEIIISIRDREKRYNPLFLKALCIALSLHCFLGTLFYVTPFKWNEVPLLNPVELEIQHLDLDKGLREKLENSDKYNAAEIKGTPYFTKFSNPKKALEYPPFHIHISGPLAEKKYLLDPTLTALKRWEKGVLVPYFAKYKVKVEGSSGKIIFYQCQECSGDKNIFEALLKKILFEKSKKNGELNGEIEITRYVRND